MRTISLYLRRSLPWQVSKSARSGLGIMGTKVYRLYFDSNKWCSLKHSHCDDMQYGFCTNKSCYKKLSDASQTCGCCTGATPLRLSRVS